MYISVFLLGSKEQEIPGVGRTCLLSGMNPNLAIAGTCANDGIAKVVDWCKAMMGFPEGSSGMLVQAVEYGKQLPQLTGGEKLL